ncbi:MAG: polyphosphate kinase [Bacteroidetes bacterium]|nr:polyphosphate kinase [Bacteroidota bacterium]MBK9800645.1 polyphosphate kinase [Bacteroidota bacterium]MBP6412009.1 polyphosphate kinase [Bacteroidia bacterium]
MLKTRLSSISTRAPKKLSKDNIKKETLKLKLKLEALQNLLYAEGKHALLVILQGMDASGKDGAIKNVFEPVNPIGCKVIAFKKPSELELKHDFLWRIHQEVPEKGMMGIFNRSHYEDVLIQRVHKWVDENTIRQRFEQINNFEKMLVDNGTIVLKFYLHVSKEEQLQRLNERLNDTSKMWKHNENDILERKLWSQYMKCYEDVFTNCSTGAEWNIIPSDQNWYKEYLITKKIVETLEALKMKFPGLKKEK